MKSCYNYFWLPVFSFTPLYSAQGLVAWLFIFPNFTVALGEKKKPLFWDGNFQFLFSGIQASLSTFIYPIGVFSSGGLLSATKQ